MDIDECIYNRRSIRKYLDKPVDKKLIEKLLDAAVYAPTARNMQPWHFSVVQDKKNIETLNRIAFSMLDQSAKDRIKSRGSDSLFYDAPCIIFISGPKDNKYLKEDCNLAAQNIMLRAHSLELGSCYIGFAARIKDNKEAKEILGIPEEMEPVVTLIVGYPAVVPEKPNRNVRILKWI